jgi:adenylate kinase family enzyme
MTKESHADLRVIIFGNSGSGKTTVAKNISEASGVRVLNLDSVFWMSSDFDKRRPEDEVYASIAKATCEPSWIVEGVYGDLIASASCRANVAIWLNLPMSLCLKQLEQRDSSALIEWASGYESRSDKFSKVYHQNIYENFAGKKIHVSTQSDLVKIEQLLK